MKQLDLYKNPKKFLEKLSFSDKKICSALVEKIEELLINPTPNASKKLVGQKNLYRVRVEKYRIIYGFDEDILSIIHIAKRDEVYDFLLKS